MKVHIVGIAGVGMSATALLMKENGWVVTGSDAECYGPPKAILSRNHISFSLGYSPENIPVDVDCFIIGRNAKLAPSENAEVRAALATGKPIYSFPEILGQITKERKNVIVAGSYGKSTTTSITAHILRYAGVDAGYFIGAEPVRSTWLPEPAKLGSAESFVLEGDEYPSSHEDPRAKFLHLHPHDILLTSVVHDHINVYPTFEEYQKPFRQLIKLLPKDGLIVVSADEPGARKLAQEFSQTVVNYGIKNEEAIYRARDIKYGEQTHFTLLKNGEAIAQMETSLLGAHNIEDITGAVAYVLARELVSVEEAVAAVREFKGVHRRLDNLTAPSKLPVFEGFGSSYEKAHAAIEAIKLHFPNKNLIIVFEPHTFGWRNRENLSWYDDIFKAAQNVFIAPPETQGAGTHDQLTFEEILSRVGESARPYYDPKDVANMLTGNEVVLILTSGSLNGSIPQLVEAILRKFPR